MSEITLLYDRSETDEQGIRLTAENIGIDLGFLPFHKVAIGIKKGELIYRSKGKDLHESLDNTKVILNRTQGKHRRILSTSILEAYGKNVLNPMTVEAICRSKIRTLLEFFKKDVNIPDTIYLPCNVKEARTGGGVQNNLPFIIDMIHSELGENVVIKPDEGSHGVGIFHAKDENCLKTELQSFEPSIINPVGLTAQEYVNKWFYDLRIIVEKRCGKTHFCHPTAMARGGFQDFRTNTYLGNMVFRVNLPTQVRELAVRCGEAVGCNSDSYVIALDAMPRFRGPASEIKKQLSQSFKDLEVYFRKVLKVKKMKQKAFPEYTNSMEEAYGDYMASEPYSEIQSFISESLKKEEHTVLFHEANACPDFWEQTRIVGGVNIAESLLLCAQSLLSKM
jgi:glutathione synthase/RimK-type ligase-like ATP-grasp enzyme